MPDPVKPLALLLGEFGFYRPTRKTLNESLLLAAEPVKLKFQIIEFLRLLVSHRR